MDWLKNGSCEESKEKVSHPSSAGEEEKVNLTSCTGFNVGWLVGAFFPGLQLSCYLEVDGKLLDKN